MDERKDTAKLVESTEKMMYNISELQQAFGIGRNLAYQLAQQRGFPTIKINGHYYFPKEKLKKWIDVNIGKSFST